MKIQQSLLDDFPERYSKFSPTFSPKGLTGLCIEAFEFFIYDSFQCGYLIVSESLEFFFSPSPGQRPFILANEHDDILDQPVRHFYKLLNALDGLIVSTQIINFIVSLFLPKRNRMQP